MILYQTCWNNHVKYLAVFSNFVVDSFVKSYRHPRNTLWINCTLHSTYKAACRLFRPDSWQQQFESPTQSILQQVWWLPVSLIVVARLQICLWLTQGFSVLVVRLIYDLGLLLGGLFLSIFPYRRWKLQHIVLPRLFSFKTLRRWIFLWLVNSLNLFYGLQIYGIKSSFTIKNLTSYFFLIS